MSDLLRSRASLWSVKLPCRLFGNAVVRHDGPLSVRRSFTTQELKNVAEKSRLSYLKVAEENWFRLSLAGEKFHVA